MAGGEHVPIERIDTSTYVIPTDRPESDGTIKWDKTALVTVLVTAGGRRGVGYTYCDRAAEIIINGRLKDFVIGSNALDVENQWWKMMRSTRNLGRPGVASCAVSAVDVALWDLKAKLFDVPLIGLLGRLREGIEVYGSGGFTSYTEKELQEQLGGWSAQGIKKVKMKVGRDPDSDLDRVAAVRVAIGDDTELFVDANGAYSMKEALRKASEFADYGVKWFEEPVSSDDLEALCAIRNRVPDGMQVAAGEYGYDLHYFRRMLEAEAVDVLQADATRCGGITGFLKASVLCESRSMHLSAHTAPSIHMHPSCALQPVSHVEYFHDHVRIEEMVFDGVVRPEEGKLLPDTGRPGLGLELKRADISKYAA
jgi:L-alanine-DL-glutamate epimerase-like enolase superfamily enzyme